MDGRIIYSEETRIEAAKQFALGHGSAAVATYLGLSRATMRTWQGPERYLLDTFACLTFSGHEIVESDQI